MCHQETGYFLWCEKDNLISKSSQTKARKRHGVDKNAFSNNQNIKADGKPIDVFDDEVEYFLMSFSFKIT